MRQQRGFSLIELLIAIALILVIAAIAVPSLLRSRASATEASAVASMRAVQTAQTAYSITYASSGYANTLLKLAPPKGADPANSEHAGLLEWVSSCEAQPCLRSGYGFSIESAVGNPVISYKLLAEAKSNINNGSRTYCMDQDGVMTSDPSGGTKCGVPLEHDPLLQDSSSQNKPDHE